MTRPVAVQSAIGPDHLIDADLISNVTWGWMGQSSVRLDLDGENFAVVTAECARNMRQAGMLPGFPPLPTNGLSAEDGAAMFGRIELKEGRHLVSCWVQLDEGWRTRTEDIGQELFDTTEAAELWLQQQAGRYDFPQVRLLLD